MLFGNTVFQLRPGLVVFDEVLELALRTKRPINKINEIVTVAVDCPIGEVVGVEALIYIMLVLVVAVALVVGVLRRAIIRSLLIVIVGQLRMLLVARAT